MTRPVVLVTSRSFSSGDDDCVARLQAAGAEVVRGATDHDIASLGADLRRAVAWIAGTSPITADHLTAAPELRLIARYGVGVDSVDRRAAAAQRIVVTNTPGANTTAVAEHALALLLALLRKVVPGDRAVRAGQWHTMRARELGSLRVGIVGFGRVGRALHTRLFPLCGQVLVHDPAVAASDVTDAGATPLGLIELARVSDVVSLHAPGGRTIVDEVWLSEVRPGLVLVNTARASLVDERALVAALRSGVIGSYATDDLGAGAGDAGSPLLDASLADRVLVTPHCAAQTVEAVDAMGAGATAAVLAILRGSDPDNVVPPPN